MKPYFETDLGRLYNSDNLGVMRKMPSEILQAAWTETAKKGNVIIISNRQYVVALNTKKTFRLKDQNSLNYTFKRYGGTFAAEGKQATIFRDAEGEIIIDLLNIDNPFHEFSDVFKLTIKVIAARRIEEAASQLSF